MRKGIYIIVFINEKLVILTAPKTRTASLLAALEPHASIMFRDPPGVKTSIWQNISVKFAKC
ncbi:MAG: hypothetical protein EBZ20_07915 [Rhodobacteraceae bacterium]|nr:hypothetical protein [Paracoccaceae bacterium]